MLLALLLASTITATEPASVVETFYQRWAAGDPRAMQSWAGGTSAAEEFERTFARTSRTRCVRLEELELSYPTEGTVVARTVTTKWSSMPGARAYTDTSYSRVTLQRVNGEWKIAAIRSLEWERADAMAQFPERERLQALAECGDECRSWAFVQALNRRVNILLNQQQYALCTQLLDLAETIAHDLGDDRAVSMVLGTRSALARVIYDARAALPFGEESVAVAERTGDPDSIARALLRLGRTHVALTSRTLAKPLLDRGYALADYIEEASVAALLATQLAFHADAMLERRDGLYYSLRAYELSKETSDPAARISAELNLAGTYEMHGHDELTIAHFQTVLKLSREAKYTKTVVSALLKLAHYHLRTDPRAAKEAIAEALSLADPEASDNTWFDVLLARANVHLQLKDFAAAEADAMKALRLAESTPERRYAISALDLMAKIHLGQKRMDEALQMAQRAEKMIEDLPAADRPDARNISIVLHAVGRTDEAIGYVERHLRSLDAQLADLTGTDLQKRQFYNYRAGNYLFYVELLLHRGDLRAAWHALQRSRSQVVLGERSPAVAADEELRKREQRVVALNKALADPKNKRRTKALRHELEQARLEIEEYENRATVTREPGAPPQIHAAVPQLPDDLAVIEYVLLEKELVAFAVTGSDMHPVRIPIDRAAFDRRIAAFAKQLENRDQNYRDEARALYDLLLAPVERQVRGKTLAIVPHGVLWTLPFHALRTRSGRHLAEEQIVFYAPSLALALPRERTGGRTSNAEVLAFANPVIAAATDTKFRAVYRGTDLGPLPHAEEEVRALARIYGRDRVHIYTGAAAREAVFKREAGRFRILHVATHGIIDDASPLYSAVLLADDATEDGVLEAREIVDLRLTADLTVLAACDTARGQITPGEGVVGMSWALLLAGCPTVAVSHWLAESEATSKLMIRFHESLAAGRSPAAAMRTAQRALMSNPRYAHPFYWAAFIVLGAGDDERR